MCLRGWRRCPGIANTIHLVRNCCLQNWESRAPIRGSLWAVSIINLRSLNSHNMKFFLAKVYLLFIDKPILFSSHPANIDAERKASFQHIETSFVHSQIEIKAFAVGWVDYHNSLLTSFSVSALTSSTPFILHITRVIFLSGNFDQVFFLLKNW